MVLYFRLSRMICESFVIYAHILTDYIEPDHDDLQ